LIPTLVFAVIIGISDGDTLTALTSDHQQIKIRLANIDAPEKKQPFGQRSKQSLSDLCYRKEAKVEPQTVDRYGRTVAVVTCDGTEANREQVERGMAWVYTRYNKNTELPQLELGARNARRGLWNERDPKPPWTWRKQKREGKKQ
jgi:micrococcal nuclease